MQVWVILAAMAVLTAAAVLLPAWRARRAASEVAPDLAVYRDQLAELDRDRERGLIGAAEAEAARTEIARRLLRAAKDDPGAPAMAARPSRWPLIAASLAIPAIAFAIYGQLGNPRTPDAPLAARVTAPEGEREIGALIARVEAHLAKNPEDGRGWDVVAPVYLRLGRADDAASAWANAIRLLGSTAARETGRGQALVAASGGVVTAEAQAAFRRASALDGKAVLPRMYLALAAEQDGRKEEAAASWRGLLAEAKGDEPWAVEARAQLARLEGREEPAAPTPTEPAAPGPSQADIAAAAEMTPEQRRAMIEGMVGQLAERLDKGGGTVDEWLRLVRAYAVLGRADDAKAAALKAREAFKADATATTRIEDAVRGLGITL